RHDARLSHVPIPMHPTLTAPSVRPPAFTRLPVSLSIRPLSAAYRRGATRFDLRMIDRVSELHGLLLTTS
ncbi:hypothetical protein, partial [Streptomyces sp. NPDC055085]